MYKLITLGIVVGIIALIAFVIIGIGVVINTCGWSGLFIKCVHLV